MEAPTTGMPRRVSSATAFLLLSVLCPTPATARSRSAPFAIRSSRSTIVLQWSLVAPGLASTRRIAGAWPLEVWLACHWAR